jgi:hypothetical protein
VNLTLRMAIATFGSEAKAKLANVAATGEPEDQLRASLEHLIVDLAELWGLPRAADAAMGESSLADLKTRPDYAITVQDALIGFIEVKAPGKGDDPRRFKDRHDKQQWEKLRVLPNLIYTDGNEFSLWRSGELEGRLCTSLDTLKPLVPLSTLRLACWPFLKTSLPGTLFLHVTRSNSPR